MFHIVSPSPRLCPTALSDYLPGFSRCSDPADPVRSSLRSWGQFTDRNLIGDGQKWKYPLWLMLEVDSVNILGSTVNNHCNSRMCNMWWDCGGPDCLICVVLFVCVRRTRRNWVQVPQRNLGQKSFLSLFPGEATRRMRTVTLERSREIAT